MQLLRLRPTSRTGSKRWFRRLKVCESLNLRRADERPGQTVKTPGLGAGEGAEKELGVSVGECVWAKRIGKLGRCGVRRK